jgi:hypothetical protein
MAKNFLDLITFHEIQNFIQEKLEFYFKSKEFIHKKFML